MYVIKNGAKAITGNIYLNSLCGRNECTIKKGNVAHVIILFLPLIQVNNIAKINIKLNGGKNLKKIKSK